MGQSNSCDKPNSYSSSLTHSVWSFNSEDRTTKCIKLMIYLSIQIDTVSGGGNRIILTINVCVQCSP